MALILSTHSTNGGLTGDQARVQNFLAFQNTDFVVDNHGGELACTQNGSSISVASGIAVFMGTIIENTAAYPLTFNLTGSGSAMVIAKVNLGTGVPALEIKQGTTLVQNDLISNQSGTREMELYRITYANSVITGFSDKRLIRGRAYNPVDLVAVKNAGGAKVEVDLSLFRVTSTTALTGSYPQTMPLNKNFGGLSLASNLITLPKGFLYELVLMPAISGIGQASFKVYSSANADQGMDAASFTDTSALNQSTYPGQGIIDLTAAGSDLQIKIINNYINGSGLACLAYSTLKIRKLLPVPFANL